MNNEINEIKELGLTTKQEIAIQLLASGKSVQEVAKEIDVHRSAIYRWFQETNFSRELNKVMDSYLHGLFFTAMSELENIIQTGRDVDKLSAITMILGLNGKNISKNGNSVNFVKVDTPKISIDDILREVENM